MRYALIQNGIVANVVEQDDTPSIPGQWVACGDAGPGWAFDGETFTAGASINAVPRSVSRFEARAALHYAGLLESVEAYMAQPGVDVITRLAWADATDFERDSPMLASIAALLNLTEQQVDDLFRAAAQISV